ncbi:MAG: GntR family transcriptional regulator [Rhizobiaceae bacterium]
MALPVTGAPADGNKAFAVYDRLKGLILSNELRPGNKLGHQMLAELLGVSRTPVRESLERLLQEGLVIRLQNRGYYVAEITEDEAVQLYDTREALEVFQLRRSMESGIKPAQLARLNKLQKRYEELIGYELGRERLIADSQFHLALAALGGNEYLVQALKTIFDRLILKRRVDGYTNSGATPLAEHQRMLDAIGEGDVETAVGALSGHIRNARDRQMAYLKKIASKRSSWKIA